MRFLSMAALALVGAVMTGCSSDDSIIGQTQPQTENKSNAVTLTTTVSIGGGAATRALTADGTKTFAVGDQIAVIYEKSDGMAKVESTALTTSDITDSGKKATFTVSLTGAKTSGAVKYIYPAAMAGDTDVDYTKLNSQDGTLNTLSSSLDLALYEGSLTSEGTLPTGSVSMENPLAILAYTLKNSDGSSDITSTITGMTVSDGTNTYSVTRSAAAGPIYVAILPTSSAAIEITATDGTNNYTKSLTGKTYAAGNGYSMTVTMTQGANLSKLTAAYEAQDGDVLTGTLANNVKISIAAGATITLKDADINGSGALTSSDYAGLTPLGNATIILEGSNKVTGFSSTYPGIYAAVSSTLTIQGTGSLTVKGGNMGCGIGSYSWGSNGGNIVIAGGNITAEGGYYAAGIGTGASTSCGTISITGGTVTATGGTGTNGDGTGIGAGNGGGTVGESQSSCGDISITGGTVTATGNNNGAGIGGGWNSKCGTITIGSGVTSVTATKGSSSPNSIGAGNGGTCGTVSIAGGANVTQN